MEFKKINLSEDTISMILGLAIVVLVVGLIFNFFQRSRGNISVPGISNTIITENEVKENLNNDEKMAEEINTKEYVVKTGDSLWSIAQNLYGDGDKWVEIAKTNDLKNPGLIHSDLVLKLPEVKQKELAVQPKELDPKTEEYSVVSGDNLWNISVAQYGDGYAWPQVYQANKSLLANPNNLEIGMKLRMPKYKPLL